MNILSTLVSMPAPDYEADRECLKYLNIYRMRWWLTLRCLRKHPSYRYRLGYPLERLLPEESYTSSKLAYRTLRDKLMFKTKRNTRRDRQC